MLTPHTPRRRHGAALAASTATLLVALTACGTSPESGESPTAPEATGSPAASSPAAAPSSTAVSVEDPETVAAEAIKLFARPEEPERRWFAELRPYLEEEYAVEAEYIDPARIPFSKVSSDPQMNNDPHNPRLTTADFKTNDGTWTVELHQDTPGGQWLVGGIAPARG